MGDGSDYRVVGSVFRNTSSHNSDQDMEQLMTIDDLRNDFEEVAQFCHFDTRRLANGEYKGSSTFVFWAGFWECARRNGLITGDDALIAGRDR